MADTGNAAPSGNTSPANNTANTNAPGDTTKATGTDPAATPAAASTATPPPPAKKKIKVYGQEEEYTDDELIALAQKGRAADRKLSELSEKEKKLEAAKAKLLEKPWEGAEEMGVKDFRQRVIQELLAEMDADKLKQENPDAYGRQQAEKELAQERKRREELEEAHNARTQQEQDAKLGDELFNKFDSALAKVGGARDPETVLHLIDLEIAALRSGHTSSAEELASHVLKKRDAQSETAVSARFDKLRALKGEELLGALPEDIWKNVQHALLARARSKIGTRVAPAREPRPELETQDKPQRYESDSSVLRRIMRG